MKPTTPVEALVESYEYRLDMMMDEYVDLLKDAADTISNQQMLIRELKQQIEENAQ